MAQVVDQAGALDGAARIRTDAALAARRDPDPIDIAALEAELAALLGDRVYV
jgi:beta-N-acetylhexosaminidase